MTVRIASLIAVAALATLAAPVLAQDGPPPPGPDFRDGPPPMPRLRDDHFGRRPMPPVDAPRFGYSPEQRGAWLDECRGNHGGPMHDEQRRGHHGPGMRGPDGDGEEYCESYLQHYESMPAPVLDPHAIQPGYVTPGYVVPPLMWVRVPIIHEHRDCGCEEVVEEEVVTRTDPRPRRAVQHRRVVHDKRVRYAK